MMGSGERASPGAASGETILMHASAVAIDGKAVLIFGPSGSGKSSLALELMALGAELVADDQTALKRRAGHVWASAPAAIAGRIEARGVGLLTARVARPAPVTLAVDLGKAETKRLPPRRVMALLGCDVEVMNNPQGAPLPAIIVQYLRGGRSA